MSESPESLSPRVVVIGAGPAGLTAALELTRAGLPPIVLESDDLVGGISRTVERDGWRFDIGGHRFFTKVPRVQEFWHDVLAEEEFPVRDRLSRIYYDGRYFDYPIKPFQAFSRLGPFEATLCALSYLRVRIRPPKDQSNFETWVAARFGWRLYRIFFKTYTEKVWGVPADTIRSDWAAQRIKGLSLPAAVLNAFKGSTEHTSLIDKFQYPLLGPGMMWERTAERVVEGGGELRLKAEVVALTRDHGGVNAIVTESLGRHQTIAADHVISSMPLGELVTALSPPPPEDVIEAAKGLSHRDFLTVALVAPEEFAFPDNWIYVHDPTVKLGRVQNFRAWSPEMVKEGRTCLGLEYFVFEGDHLWNTKDDELIEFATEEITRIGLLPKDVVEGGFVVRMPKAYPVYDAGYAERVETIRQWIEREVPNLHPVGRNGMHRYNNQDHSMLTAMLAVENVLGARHDVWTVNVDAEYHEAGPYGARPPGTPDDESTDPRSGSTGRAAPTLIVPGEAGDTRPSAAAGSRRTDGALVRLSQRSALARGSARLAFRSLLNARRRARSFLRLFSTEHLSDRPLVKRVQWLVYRGAFKLSTVAPLRRIHFTLRDRLSRGRSQVVPLERLLVGGWNGMSARQFAEASGFLLDPSTRLVDSAQVDLLRRFDRLGDALYSDELLSETPYVERVRAAARISGHHRGVSHEAGYYDLAREFLDRYLERPVPFRPGRTVEGALPRVRRIARSDYYEIRDGHHRLAIELARGASESVVIVERSHSSTPMQRLLRRMSWLDGQDRLYQPVDLPEVATWSLMRRSRDRLSLMESFLADRYRDSPRSTPRSYLDVGACYGWFVAQMAERGYESHGIEQDPLSQDLAALIYGLEPAAMQVGDALDILANQPARYDVVSCFSMLHHFVLGRSAHSAEKLIRTLDEATGDVLFLDTGESHESWFRFVLPEWDSAYARRWILDHTTFTEVQALGRDHDDVGKFRGKFGRMLFACTR